MYHLIRCAMVTFFSASLLLLSGCFPADDSGTNPTPFTDPINNNDNPTDLPTDINASANTSEAGIDSMFNLLITRSKKLDSLNSSSDLYAIDFSSLRKGFGAAVNKNPNHVKANVGFIVSSVLSINENKDIQKVVDSIDAYVNNMDAYYDDSPVMSKKRNLTKTKSLTTGFLTKTFRNHGLLSAGQALVAETPKILMAQNSRPTFPRFLTLSYIQNTIESGIIPRLNEVIAAAQRLKAVNNMSLMVTIDGETTELDNGDILILEGTVRAARAGFTMMLIYDADIYSPDGSNDMRWIDKFADAMDNADDKVMGIYSLHGDTLYDTYYYDETSSASYINDVYQYNYGRAGFLSIRKNYHLAVYNDLKEIPVLFKAGLTAIRNETDNQDDDLIPAIKISDMSEDMAKFSNDMLDEGFSPSFASKFQSPESFMDFISLVLSGPYRFNETIDKKQVAITVDISQFFTNPASSLKEYWPKCRLSSGDEKYVSYCFYTPSIEWSSTPRKTLSVYNDDYDSVSVNIPASLIDSSRKSTYGTTTYYLKNGYHYTSSKDSARTITPLIYLDDNGNSINMYNLIYQDITKETLPKVFPYFNDYTFKGIFPDMKTRQAWIDFFGVFVE